jgi:hypothetical protein
MSVSDENTKDPQAVAIGGVEEKMDVQSDMKVEDVADNLASTEVKDEHDSEEETWTNQPHSSSAASSADLNRGRFSDDDDDDDSSGYEEEGDDEGELYDEDDDEFDEEEEDGDYSDSDEDDDQERRSRSGVKGADRPQRKQIQNARDVVCEELPERVALAAARLKPFLSGSFVFHFTNSGERFLFDWRGDSPSTRQLDRSVEVTCDEAKGHLESDNAVNVDSVISISEANLMAIRSGSLNPQVGMLTDKIRVRGKVSPAVYVFNAVAPRGRA